MNYDQCEETLKIDTDENSCLVYIITSKSEVNSNDHSKNYVHHY